MRMPIAMCVQSRSTNVFWCSLAVLASAIRFMPNSWGSMIVDEQWPINVKQPLRRRPNRGRLRTLYPINTIQCLRAFADDWPDKPKIKAGSALIKTEAMESGRGIPNDTNLKSAGIVGQIPQQTPESRNHHAVGPQA